MVAEALRRGLEWARPQALWLGVGGLLALVAALAAVRGNPLIVGTGLLGLFFLAMIDWPHLAALALFISLMFDQAGRLDVSVAGLPLTMSKLATGVLMGVLATRWAMVRPWASAWTPMSRALVVLMAAMLWSLIWRQVPEYEDDGTPAGRLNLVSTAMVILMAHAVAAAIADAHVRTVARVAALASMLVLGGAIFNIDETLGRSAGSFGDPNAWAGVVMLACHFAFGVLSGERLGRVATLVVVPGVFAVYAAALFQSGSRGGLIAAIVLSPLTLWLLRGHWRGLLLGVLAAGLLAPAVTADPQFLTTRFSALWEPELHSSQHTGVDSIEGRWFFQVLAWEQFLENPWMGIGLGGFKTVSADYFPLFGGRDAHNTYMQVLCEQGLLGISVLAAWLWSVVNMVWKTVRDPAAPAWVQSAVAGLGVGWLGFALVNTTIGELLTSAFAWFYLGLLAALVRGGAR